MSSAARAPEFRAAGLQRGGGAAPSTDVVDAAARRAAPPHAPAVAATGGPRARFTAKRSGSAPERELDIAPEQGRTHRIRCVRGTGGGAAVPAGDERLAKPEGDRPRAQPRGTPPRHTPPDGVVGEPPCAYVNTGTAHDQARSATARHVVRPHVEQQRLDTPRRPSERTVPADSASPSGLPPDDRASPDAVTAAGTGHCRLMSPSGARPAHRTVPRTRVTPTTAREGVGYLQTRSAFVTKRRCHRSTREVAEQPGGEESRPRRQPRSDRDRLAVSGDAGRRPVTTSPSLRSA